MTLALAEQRLRVAAISRGCDCDPRFIAGSTETGDRLFHDADCPGWGPNRPRHPRHDADPGDAWRALPDAPPTLPGHDVRLGVDRRHRLSLSRFADHPGSSVR